MLCEQYQRLSGKPSGFAEILQAWRTHYLSPDLNPEPVGLMDDPFVGVRQLDAAREFSW